MNGIQHHGVGTIRTVTDPYCAGDQSVALSGPFDCLPKVEIGPLGRRARFSPQQAHCWKGVTPALLLDASLRVAGMHVVPGALHVPTRIRRAFVPVGHTTDSRAAAGWQIRTSVPMLEGEHIRCDRVEVTDARGDLQLIVEGALVTQLR